MITIYSNPTADAAWADGDKEALDAAQSAVWDELTASNELVDAASHERAVEIAGKFAEVKYSPIEVRRLMHTEEAS